MKFNFRKFRLVLLACLLCFSMLVSCGGDPTSTTTPTTENNGGDNGDADRLLTLVADGEAQYKIVVSKNATSYEWDAANNVRLIILTMTGASISIIEDTEAAPQENEIIIGANTNRNTLYTVPVDYDKGYCTFISGNRLVLEARSERGMKLAVQNLGKDCFGVNILLQDFYKGEELSELTVKASYQRSETFDATSFVLVHNDTVYTKRMSYVFLSLFQSISGAKYFVESTMASKAPAANSGSIVISIVEDATIGNGEWALHQKGDGIYEVHAADYYGFTAAARYFKSYVAQNRKSEQPYPASAVGSYLDEGILTKHEASTAYAFTHTGDIRVMFNNILFHEQSVSQRNIYNAELFSIYMPDVLGLQEVNIGRRGDVEEGNGGVIKELEKLGYAETIDPRVHNAYTSSQKIPGTDASLTTDTTEHVELNGYGVSGAIQVTLNGETFYTYYNHTPLLYNTATTKCIESGYYWYKNQWDKRTGANHENGSSDCGSKSATWGLFEDLETGERYIVISTHMCTRSEYVRGLQGAEMMAFIDELIATYDAPVLFGGDYNGTYGSANYLIFAEGGLVNPKTEKLASIFTTMLGTTHQPYPVYDADYKLTVPAKGNALNTTSTGNMIDHIMIKNHDAMEIFVFGTVVDEMALSGADHLPIFIDFSLNSNSSNSGK